MFRTLCATVLIVVTCLASHVPVVHGEKVQINGKYYYFGNATEQGNYDDSVAACAAINMTLVGLETEQEWNAILQYLDSNSTAKYDWYWTSGRYTYLEGNFTWTNTGVIIDENDPRWSIGEPTKNDKDGVALYFPFKALFAVSFDQYCYIFCEEII